MKGLGNRINSRGYDHFLHGLVILKTTQRSNVALTSVSVILPVINETYSLTKTVDILESECRNDIGEYLIVVCKKTTPESLKTCDELKAKLGNRVTVHFQTLPFLGGAMREAFELSRGSHTIMMASDLETDPHTARDLIAQAKLKPDSIVTATRWVKGGGFRGYNPLKLFLNKIFQSLFGLLYFTRLTDMTYGYRIFPNALLKQIDWKELRHPFLFETLVKPLRLGVRVSEVPTQWKARSEGESQNTFFRNFEYLRIGVKTRFASRQSLLRHDAFPPAAK
jgi:glycosyltransferase involved in cell wall biosynthesis